MKTTLNKIRGHHPCTTSWIKLLTHLGKTEADDTEISILQILAILGIDDALWALRAVTGHDREIRLLAADFAEHVLGLYEAEYPEDARPRLAIEAARASARGEISPAELAAARDAAWAAAGAAAWDAAGDAAWDAAGDAAWAAERRWQEDKLRELLAPPAAGKGAS